MRNILLLFLILITVPGLAQQFSVKLVSAQQLPVEGASIQMKRTADSTLVKTALTNKEGIGTFQQVPHGDFYFVMEHVGYQTLQTASISFPNTKTSEQYTFYNSTATLQSVTIASRKPFIQQVQGKTVLNVDAMISNTGTTVLELLEKSPGILVDRNGGISMQNKAGVLVLIDDKPTYLSGADLNNMLSSMSSSQVEQIELITNPSAKYDAAGNAGIINIKTKKNRQVGFNGNFTVSAGHGRYYKNNNSLVMNYRNGKFNSFFTYANNNSKHYTKMYALRTYYDDNGNTISELDQPTLFLSRFNNHNIKTGLDYFISNRSTIGIALFGNITHRNGSSHATATWMDAFKNIDSSINTNSTTAYEQLSGTLTLYGKHSFSKNSELSIDADMLNYDIKNNQLFTNEADMPQYYYEGSLGNLPSTLKILSAKTDYVWKFAKESQWEAGAKLANTRTDNLANYQKSEGAGWEADPGRSNHFLYDETIRAIYSSVQQEFRRWSYQAGLRFENTSYTGRQLGNGTTGSDSSFTNDYTSLFPSGFVSFEADSNHSFTVTLSRRLDRPPFQKLNPFFFTINKYTYERGNPFTRPQFSWNFELSHLFKQTITTTLSYSFIKDYYSQIFYNDSSGLMDDKLIIYSTGNVGRSYNIGASVSAQINATKWWFFTAQGLYNYKKLMGFVWNNYNSDVHQFNFNMNNQFKIGKTYTAELSGFYTGRARNDLQEVLYPISQVVVAASRPVLKKKATLKLSVRDIFHKNGMEGLSDFEKSTEYFWVKRDSRVATLSFTYRFGKAFKTIRRNSGSATEESQRAGS